MAKFEKVNLEGAVRNGGMVIRLVFESFVEKLKTRIDRDASSKPVDRENFSIVIFRIVKKKSLFWLFITVIKEITTLTKVPISVGKVAAHQRHLTDQVRRSQPSVVVLI